jgi:hypothetical protein
MPPNPAPQRDAIKHLASIEGPEWPDVRTCMNSGQ